MCGRYAIATERLSRIENALGVALPAVEARYNVALTQQVPVLRAVAGGYDLVAMRWGLVPAWSTEPRTRYATFNARAETVAVKPAFRAAYRARRCLVPATGFYEWQLQGGHKVPWYVTSADGAELAFAGLWEEWRGADGSALLSCTLIVGEANAVVAPVHDRMVVILGPGDYAAWLDPRTERAPLDALLRPRPACGHSAARSHRFGSTASE